MELSKAVVVGVVAADGGGPASEVEGGGASESWTSDAGGSWHAGGGRAEHELACVAHVKVWRDWGAGREWGTRRRGRLRT